VNFLETIVGTKKAGVEEAKQILGLAELKSLVADVRPKNDFRKRLLRENGNAVRVIAEIKRASPSKGMIAAEIEPRSVAEDYSRGGAAAISVLTESSFFKGSTRDFQTVRDAVPGLPLLRKDFIVDEYQIYESVLIGADAILLIVAALEYPALERFLGLSKECGLGALVEVHKDEELDAALSAGAEIIGVNNRDLATFEVSPRTSERIAKKIPRGIVSVSESGISAPEGVLAAGELGYHAVLIGEHFMRSADKAAEVGKFARPGGVGDFAG
jgi:indole-3-glycerol phosphate synthase